MEITTHPGTVLTSTPGRVNVQIQVNSACSACQAHARCTLSEKKDKTIEVDTPDWQTYSPGDRVTVIINSGRGLLAVLIAYILPSAVILGTFALLYSLRLPDLWIAISALLAVAIYCAFLYLFRHRLQRRFTFTLQKSAPSPTPDAN